MPLCLHVATPTAHLPELSIPLRRYTYIEPSDLHTFKPTRYYTFSTPPELQSSPQFYCVYTTMARPQRFMPPRRYTTNAPPTLHTSTSLHEQRTSNAPTLHTSTLEEDDRRTCNVTPFASFTPRDPLLSALAKGCEQAMQTF